MHAPPQDRTRTSPDLRFLEGCYPRAQWLICISWTRHSAAAGQAGEHAPDEDEALDAYSRVVTRVVEKLTPSVASLRVRKRDRAGRQAEGSGSGVVISADGFILTSAHVVEGTEGGSASFVDGQELGLEVVGADPLSDMAVVRATAQRHGGDVHCEEAPIGGARFVVTLPGEPEHNSDVQ
jgi:S1-C subfamily serine protease